jgi:hypothetical protein
MAFFRYTGVIIQESAAQCNAVYIPVTVIASGYGYVVALL